MKLKQLGPNMTELRFTDHLILFSYETPVAGWHDCLLFKTKEKYSRTTTKHINKYFRDQWGVNPLSVEKVTQDYIDSLVS